MLFLLFKKRKWGKNIFTPGFLVGRSYLWKVIWDILNTLKGISFRRHHVEQLPHLSHNRWCCTADSWGVISIFPRSIYQYIHFYFFAKLWNCQTKDGRTQLIDYKETRTQNTFPLMKERKNLFHKLFSLVHSRITSKCLYTTESTTAVWFLEENLLMKIQLTQHNNKAKWHFSLTDLC